MSRDRKPIKRTRPTCLFASFTAFSTPLVVFAVDSMRRSTLTSSCACFDDYVSNEAFCSGTVIRCTFESIFDNQRIDKMNCDSSLLSGNPHLNQNTTSWHRFRISSPSFDCYLPFPQQRFWEAKQLSKAKDCGSMAHARFERQTFSGILWVPRFPVFSSFSGISIC